MNQTNSGMQEWDKGACGPAPDPRNPFDTLELWMNDFFGLDGV